MLPRLAVLSSTLLVLVGLVATRADAQAIRAAALTPQFKNNTGSPELRDKFHDVVVQGLAPFSGPSGPNGELGDVLTAAETRDHLGDQLATCSNEQSCLARAGAALHVNRLVSTELTVAGKSYSIAMRLYDGNGHELTHANELCEICTVHEAEEAVQKTAAKLVAASRMFPVQDVSGKAHAETRTPPPVVEAPPHATTAPPASPMEENPNPPPRPIPRRGRYVPWRALGFGAVGIAVVGLAVGIPLLVIDGRPTCNSADAIHTCPHVYNTTGGGAALVTIGALGVVAAVPLFYLDWRDRHREYVSIDLRAAPLYSGGALTLTGRF